MKKIGFKFYWVLLISIVLVSCKTRKGNAGSDVIRFDGQNWSSGNNGPDVDTPEVTDTVIQIVAIDTVIIDTIVPVEVIKKDVYEVALVLPFMEDSMRRSWSNSKAKNFQEMIISNESELSSSFLEGIILAMKDLDLDSKFNIQIYDDNNSETRMTSVLAKMKDKDFDFVIGPLNKKNVMAVSEYAKEKGIPHLSPFSPSKTASMGNDKYYQFEPSLEQHILSMINFGLDSIEDPHFKFIYHGKASGQAYADMVSMHLDKINEDKELGDRINYSNIELSSKLVNTSFKLSDYVDEGANNVVIVNSFDENFIHLFLRQVKDAMKNNNLVIFGMPGWVDSKIVRLEYISSAELHFTRSYWYNEENPDVELFESIYKTKYGTYPSEYAFMGYDFAELMFGVIDEHGLAFNDNFLGEEFNGLGRNYLFKQVMTSEEDILRIENTKLRIYKILEFEPTLVK